MMTRIKCLIASVILLSCSLLSIAQTAVDECLIKVGTPESVGPINMHSFSGQVMGYAYLSNDANPDIFMQSDRWYPEFVLYEAKGRDGNGIPIFSDKKTVSLPGNLADDTSVSYIFQTDDKNVHLLFYKSETKKVHYALYNKNALKFEEKRSMSIPSTLTTPSSLTAYKSSDNKLHIFLGVRNEWDTTIEDDSLSHYRGDGIYRGKMSSIGLYEFSCNGWLEGGVSQLRLVSPTDAETLKNFHALRMIDLGTGKKGNLVAGAYFGAISYYENTGTEQNPIFSKRAHVSDAQGNAIRHPGIWPAPATYPNAEGKSCDIIASGEGGVYYYKFTGQFTAERKPIYEEPVYVLEKNANLFGGSLIVPNVVDWDGDGVLDIVSGNSQGFILFFKNKGTNESPLFQPGVALEANGEKIWIQGGYAESNQGAVEARWGYASPTVVDWNEDGYLDIVMNDARSKHMVFMGTPSGLDAEHPIYLDDLELRGTWRCRPGVAKIGDRTAYITMDDDNEIHLYWRLDDYNLEDGRKLLMTDGRPISSTPNSLSSGTGRIKFEIVDWDGDGVLDLLLGSNKWMTIPDASGIPSNSATTARGASVIYLKNVGTDESPVYERPVALKYNNKPFHFFGHCIGVVATSLGLSDPNGQPNLLVGDERGRFYLLDRTKLSNTDTQYAGVAVDIFSMTDITTRKVSNIKIYPNANYYFVDKNKCFGSNFFTQIKFGRTEAITIQAKNEGYVYIATDAQTLPTDMQNWMKVESTGLAYTDGTEKDFLVYKKAVEKNEVLSIPQLGTMGTLILSQDIAEGCFSDTEIPGYIIATHLAKTKETIDNPSILKLKNSEYLVSYDLLSATKSSTIIMKSIDGGESWNKLATLDAGKKGTLFMHNEVIYLLGESHADKNIMIQKSIDGITWTKTGPGILFLNQELSSTPIVKANGRIWKTVKSTADNSVSFISAPENADISSRVNWIISSSVPYMTPSSSDLSKLFGNTILAKDGNVMAIWSLNDSNAKDQLFTISVDATGKTATLLSPSNITIVGGDKKFTARYDDYTNRFWAITNSIHKDDLESSLSSDKILNNLSIVTSSNFSTWQSSMDVLYKETPSSYAFRKPDWDFDGNTILLTTCVTWPDCTGTPASIDDSNYLIFYSIEDPDYSSIEVESSLGQGYKVYPNPAKDELFIESGNFFKDSISYAMTNMYGQVILQGATLNSSPIDVSSCSRGTYVLCVEGKEMHKVILK